MSVKLASNKKEPSLSRASHTIFQVSLGEEWEAFQLAGVQQQDAAAAGQGHPGHHQSQD